MPKIDKLKKFFKNASDRLDNHYRERALREAKDVRDFWMR